MNGQEEEETRSESEEEELVLLDTRSSPPVYCSEPFLLVIIVSLAWTISYLTNN